MKGWNPCWVKMIWTWMSDESWMKQRTEGCAIFETFSSESQGELLVVSGARWDKHQKRLNAPLRPNSSSSSDGRNVQLTWQQTLSSSMSGRHWQEGLVEQRDAWSSS